jgi:hypothetical protein
LVIENLSLAIERLGAWFSIFNDQFSMTNFQFSIPAGYYLPDFDELADGALAAGAGAGAAWACSTGPEWFSTAKRGDSA